MTDRHDRDTTMLVLATAAGLQKAIDSFPEDVRAAANAAAHARQAFAPPADAAAEPWPPMRTGACI
jgi:hypothetical protein